MKKFTIKPIIRKKIIFSLLVLSTQLTYSQVKVIGINTEKPQSELDVNGDITIRGPLKIGLNSDPGEVDEVLISDGVNIPSWQPYSTVTGPGGIKYVLTDVLSKNSKTGISFSSDQVFDIQENMALVSPWVEMPNTTVSMKVEEENSFALLYLETSILSDYTPTSADNNGLVNARDSYIEYVGGIFLKEVTAGVNTTPKLVTVRKDRLIGYKYPYNTFVIFFILPYLSVGEYELTPAFVRTGSSLVNSTNKTLFIGSTPTSTISKVNPFMTKTTLKVDLYAPNN